MANLRAANVLHLSTLFPCHELLNDGNGKPLVDIFAINAEMYKEARRTGLWEAAKARGSSFWFYTALLNRDTPFAPQWLRWTIARSTGAFPAALWPIT